MKRWIAWCVVAAASSAGLVGLAAPARSPDGNSSAYEIKLPEGYRNWNLISIGRIGGNVRDMRAKLGNEIAMKAYREGKGSFPEGSIIARLAWRETNSEEDAKALRPLLEKKFGKTTADTLIADAFVAGPPTNVQLMIKDSKKYAATGGWGFAQFTDGKLDHDPPAQACFGCHAPAKDRDFVYTRYAP